MQLFHAIAESFMFHAVLNLSNCLQDNFKIVEINFFAKWHLGGLCNPFGNSEVLTLVFNFNYSHTALNCDDDYNNQ